LARKGYGGTRITISRDGGRTWDRTSSREDWIAPGSEQDSYDRILWPSCPPLRIGEEDWFYMTAIDGDHLGVLRNPEQSCYHHDRMRQQRTALYVQKHDRYVSLTARTHKEVLITKPVVLGKNELQLNVDASHGEVRVAIASAEPVCLYENAPVMAPHFYERTLLDGFGFDDCEPIQTNHIEHVVRFLSGKTPAELKGKPVYLLFEMFDADLYGFRAVSR
jgi:hypothetical protein